MVCCSSSQVRSSSCIAALPRTASSPPADILSVLSLLSMVLKNMSMEGSDGSIPSNVSEGIGPASPDSAALAGPRVPSFVRDSGADGAVAASAASGE